MKLYNHYPVIGGIPGSHCFEPQRYPGRHVGVHLLKAQHRARIT